MPWLLLQHTLLALPFAALLLSQSDALLYTLAPDYSCPSEIGLGLAAFGFLFTVLGVMLFFDRGLLAMGNVSAVQSSNSNSSSDLPPYGAPYGHVQCHKRQQSNGSTSATTIFAYGRWPLRLVRPTCIHCLRPVGSLRGTRAAHAAVMRAWAHAMRAVCARCSTHALHAASLAPWPEPHAAGRNSLTTCHTEITHMPHQAR